MVPSPLVLSCSIVMLAVGVTADGSTSLHAMTFRVRGGGACLPVLQQVRHPSTHCQSPNLARLPVIVCFAAFAHLLIIFLASPSTIVAWKERPRSIKGATAWPLTLQLRLVWASSNRHHDTMRARSLGTAQDQGPLTELMLCLEDGKRWVFLDSLC